MTEVVVTGIGVVTPWGSDCGSLSGTAARPPMPEGSWFDVRTELGPRGYKYLPPACRYLLAAGRRALTGADEAPGNATAVVVGTNHCASALHAEMDQAVITSGVDALSPAVAPFFSVNVFASRLSIEHASKAFSLTLTTPRVAGLESIQVAARALRLGRAQMVLAGAAEAAQPGDPEGEEPESGAAVLVLEERAMAASRGAEVLGTVSARAVFAQPGNRAANNASAVTAGAWAAVTRDAPASTTLLRDDSQVGRLVERELNAVAGRLSVLPLRAGCAGPVWQVARLLAEGGGTNVVAVACRTGHIALTAVRRQVPPGD